MSTLRIFIARLKGLFATQRRDEELNEELQAHLEVLVEENRRKGIPEEQARRAASLKFGGIALGAERGAILGMVLRETAVIVLAGIAVGVPAAWIASNLLKTRLFGLTPHDPWSIAMSIVATLVVTMIAGYIPARRASRVDPMVALRHE